MKNLGYKLKFIFSNPIKTIGKILVNASSIVGFFVALFEILDTAYKSTTHMDFLVNKSIWWIIICSLVISMSISINWIPKISYTINGTDSKLTVRVGDILKYKKSLIISTNTSFVTTLTNDIIIDTIIKDKFVEVIVSDSGYGISDEAKPHIFERFYTDLSRVVDGKKSLGLGLSLCKSIVIAHDGNIRVENNSPKGTKAIFTLPILEVNANE